MSAHEPSAGTISIDTRWDGSVPVLHVVGVLEEGTVADLTGELSRACTVRGDVAVDLTSVPTADATGIAPLVAAARALRNRDARLVVRGAGPSVYRLITMLDPTKAVDLT